MKSPTSLQPILLYRFAFVITLATITWLALIDPSNLGILSRWDKWLHACSFITLSFLLDHSFHPSNKSSRHQLAQAGFLLAYGVMIEWLQSYTPLREASFFDVVADSVGIVGYWLAKPAIYTGQGCSKDG